MYLQHDNMSGIPMILILLIFIYLVLWPARALQNILLLIKQSLPIKTHHISLVPSFVTITHQKLSFTVTSRPQCIPRSLLPPSLAYHACPPSFLERHFPSRSLMASQTSPTPPPSSRPSRIRLMAYCLMAHRLHPLPQTPRPV